MAESAVAWNLSPRIGRPPSVPDALRNERQEPRLRCVYEPHAILRLPLPSNEGVRVTPLSQSRQQLLSCPHRYRSVVLDGNKDAPTQEQVRGAEIHDIAARYLRHLLDTRQCSDFARLAEMCVGMTPEGAAIMQEMQERLVIDPETLYGAEVNIALDEDFKLVASESWRTPGADKRPALGAGAAQEAVSGVPNVVAYEMTLDAVWLLNEAEGVIRDWKSAWAFSEAETFQAKLYSVGLFALVPSLERMTFILEFVRFGATRQVVFHRGQIDTLKTEIRWWREYQKRVEAPPPPLKNPDDITPEEWKARRQFQDQQPSALPGVHCQSCRLLSNGCPIEEMTPWANHWNVEDRLRLAAYHREAAKLNTAIVKEHVKANGPLTIQPGLTAEFALSSQISFPATDCLPILQKWDKESGDELAQKATLGGIATAIKAKKRGDLADQLSVYAIGVPRSKFKIGKSGEQPADEENGE